MTVFETIVAKGNGFHFYTPEVINNRVRCADGFSVSVRAGGGMYCTPRPVHCMCAVNGSETYKPPTSSVWWGPETVFHDYPGPYTAVELGFPSERPEPWDVWRTYAEESDRPKDTVYAYVPVQLVRDLIELHGGEVTDA